jgi:hypothetical protein
MVISKYELFFFNNRYFWAKPNIQIVRTPDVYSFNVERLLTEPNSADTNYPCFYLSIPIKSCTFAHKRLDYVCVL